MEYNVFTVIYFYIKEYPKQYSGKPSEITLTDTIIHTNRLKKQDLAVKFENKFINPMLR